MAYILTGLCAYLLGSIPTGYLVARARGVDIRATGSGNIGATNAFRVLGRRWGILVLTADFVKGLLACLVVPMGIVAALGADPSHLRASLLALLAAVCAVLGHNFTVWLRFKGGKGIATTAGALAALVPWALLIAVVVWVLLFVVTRYVSVGSIAAAVTVPLATWFTTSDRILTALTAVLGLLAIYKHRSNIQRLLAGTESRLELRSRRRGDTH